MSEVQKTYQVGDRVILENHGPGTVEEIEVQGRFFICGVRLDDEKWLHFVRAIRLKPEPTI
jgi:hypothetical protein